MLSVSDVRPRLHAKKKWRLVTFFLLSFLHKHHLSFQDKLKFYLPESLLYKINNPDAEFMIHIGVVLLVIVLIILLIGDLL